MKAYLKQFDLLILKEGVIYRRLESLSDTAEPDQLLLPKALRQEFLTLVHEGIAGHLGMYKTRMHIRRRAYWFRWREETDIFCKTCVKCNKYSISRVALKQGRLKPMVMGSPVKRWACDLARPFPPSSRGYTYILTAVYVFSKFVILVPFHDKCDISVATAIMNHVFLRFGVSEIFTDNGLELPMNSSPNCADYSE